VPVRYTDALSSVVPHGSTIHLSFGAKVAAGIEVHTLLNL